MLQDVKFALRTLFKQRFVSAMVILCLGLVVAANTTVFSVVRSYLIKPLPYESADRLAFLGESQREAGGDSSGLSVPNFVDYRERNDSFEVLAASSGTSFNLTGDGPPEQIAAQIVTPDMLPMLGVQPILGRHFTAEEGRPGAPRVMLLSHDLWQRRFGGGRDILGDTILLDHEAYEVVGALPADFEYVSFTPTVAYVPMIIDQGAGAEAGARADRTIEQGFGRLAEGVSADQARADLARIAADLEREYPEANRGYEAEVQGLHEVVPGPTDTILFSMIQGGGLFVLLIACANIANLLLVRGQARSRELALRSALGAGRVRILRQLLTENVVLAMCGGALGVGLGILGVRALRSALAGGLPRAFLPEVDPWVLGFSLLISACAGLVFGMVPSIQALRGDFANALREGGARGSVGGRRMVANGFVIAQVALALALVTGAGVLLATFLEIQYGHQGFDSHGQLTFTVTLPEDEYSDDASRVAFEERLLEELRAVPNAEAAAATTARPRSRNVPVTGIQLEGREPSEDAAPRVSWLAVSPGFFDALDITRLRGRDFGIQDRIDAPPVVVVDQRFVERFFPDLDPLGQYIQIHDQNREIVGVVSAVRQRRVGGLDGPKSVVYLPRAQQPRRRAAYLMRVAAGEPGALAEAARQAVWSIDPNLPVASVMTLDDFIAVQLIGMSVFTFIIGAFGIFALVLAALGVYAVLAYSVAQRTPEIGVRMALGARRRDVLAMILRQGLVLAGIGLLLGAPLVVVVTRLASAALGSLVEGQGTLASAIGFGLLLVTLLASYLPAHRAAGLAPTKALRLD